MQTGNKKGKGKKPNAQDVRAFRHNVSILKKKGLVSKRVDARKQRLTRYMKEKVKNYEGVIKGTDAVVWRDPTITEQYARAGYKTASLGRRRKGVIVPKDQAAQVRHNKGELITMEVDVGNVIVERVLLPVNIKDMEEFIREGLEHPERLDKLKRPDQLFGFTYYGNRSIFTFPSIEDVADELTKYKTIGDQATWDNFVLVSMREAEGRNWQFRDYEERSRRKKAAAREGREKTFRFVQKTDADKAKDHRTKDREYRQRVRENASEQDKAKMREYWKLQKRSERGGLKRPPK